MKMRIAAGVAFGALVLTGTAFAQGVPQPGPDYVCVEKVGGGQQGMSGMSGMSGMGGMSGMSGMSGMGGMSGMSGMSGMGGDSAPCAKWEKKK